MEMRYYAQYTVIPKLFLSGHKQAWMVFDREVITREGDVLPILMASNRHVAFDTRDALNEKEQRK